MNDQKSFVLEQLSVSGNAADKLLQILCNTQQRFSYISPTVVALLSDKLNITSAQIYGVVDFYTFLHRHARGHFDILFSNNITDLLLGNQTLFNSLCDRLGVKPGIPRADGRVTVDKTSCTGLCDQGPALLVNGLAVAGLSDERITLISRLIETSTPVEEWPQALFQIKDNIQLQGMLLSDQILRGSAIESLLDNDAETILEALELSGLRGRGGAGFYTAKKWRYCQQFESDEHYVVCNADEGEPGTFKDRVLLNRYADDIFEGMTLCAAIIGAKKGFLYLRGEYRYLLSKLEKTLQKRRANNLLGKNILGSSGFDFDIEIHLGAGAYICGEESALIESLEGKRGIPRRRPPYPVTHGYHDKPTVVNNVETFVASSKIAVFGADWFRSKGTETSTGTKLLSISGDCARPGIYEVDFGTSIEAVLDSCGAIDTQAVQMSGAAGSTIPPEEFSRKLGFEDVSTGGSMMIFDQRRDLLDMVKNFTQFFVHESCGFCTPCRVGSSLVNDLIYKVQVGHATRHDLKELQDIGRVMQHSSFCGLGATAANPVLDTLKKFPQTYTSRLANRGYEPAFDMDAALDTSRAVTGREDEKAHIRHET